MKAFTIINGVKQHFIARLKKRPVWSHVTLLVTHRCNCRCPYCDFYRHADQEMDTETVLSLLDKLKKMGTFRLSISGGEPLLRPDLPEILHRANKLGFITSLVTNGTLLAEKINQLDLVDYYLCTIEGDESHHDEIRGEGAYKKALEGLQAVKKHKSGKVGLICPVHRNNLNFIDVPLAIAETLNAKVFYQPIQTSQDWVGPNFENELSDSEEREVFKKIGQWKKSGLPVGNSDKYIEWMTTGDIRKRPFDCSAGKYFVTILPDGRISPCCMLPPDEKLPKITVGSSLQNLPVLSIDECKGCSIAPYVENAMLYNWDISSWINAVKWR